MRIREQRWKTKQGTMRESRTKGDARKVIRSNVSLLLLFLLLVDSGDYPGLGSDPLAGRNTEFEESGDGLGEAIGDKISIAIMNYAE